MAISRLTNWVSNQVLSASALNAEFNNVIDNALALISPLSGTLNANAQQITNMRLENLTTTQAAGNAGRVYYQSTVKNVDMDDGTLMRRIAAIQPATGYMTYINTASAWVGLAPGSNGQVLTMGASLPQWGSGAASVLQVQVFS